MQPTPRWNEELPLRPARPLPPPQHYSLSIDGRHPISIVFNRTRPPAEPELRGLTPRLATISGAAIKRQVRLAKLRAQIMALPPATRDAYLRQLRAKARAKGVR